MLVELNTNTFRNYSGEDPNHSLRVLKMALDLKDASSQTHPRICDLYSGEGAIAGFLVSHFGFKPENIVCIDKYRPTKPLIEGAHWEFIDLTESYERCFTSEGKPTGYPFNNKEEISKFKSKFDLVTCFYPYGVDRENVRWLAGLLIGQEQNDGMDCLFAGK